MGLLTSPAVFLSPYLIPVLMGFLRGELEALDVLILVLSVLVDLRIAIIVIACLALGVLFGALGSRLKAEKESKDIRNLSIFVMTKA